MPSKSSKKKAAVELPSILKEVLDQMVSGPMTAEAINAASMAFKKALIERALGAELSHHLGYPLGTDKPTGSANHRNGVSGKTVLTDDGPLRIEVPRDRAPEFDSSQSKTANFEMRVTLSFPRFSGCSRVSYGRHGSAERCAWHLRVEERRGVRGIELEDLEFEILHVAETSGAPTQKCDGDIAGLQPGGRDRMIGISADAGTVRLQGLHEGSQAGDPGGPGHPAPVIETSGHFVGRGTGLPQALQLLLERIESRQGLVLRQQLIQSSLVGVLEGGAIRQQQPQATLDRLLARQVAQRLGSLELGTAAIADHLAEHLHDVEAVEDDRRLRQTFLHSGDIGRPHVERHGRDASSTLLRQGIEEFQQNGRVAPLLDPQDAT